MRADEQCGGLSCVVPGGDEDHGLTAAARAVRALEREHAQALDDARGRACPRAKAAGDAGLVTADRDRLRDDVRTARDRRDGDTLGETRHRPAVDGPPAASRARRKLQRLAVAGDVERRAHLVEARRERTGLEAVPLHGLPPSARRTDLRRHRLPRTRGRHLVVCLEGRGAHRRAERDGCEARGPLRRPEASRAAHNVVRA